MQFSSDFVHNLNSNGQLLKSRLSVSFSLHQHSPGFLGNPPRGRWGGLLLLGQTRLLMRHTSLALAQRQAVIYQVQALAGQLVLLVRRGER